MRVILFIPAFIALLAAACATDTGSGDTVEDAQALFARCDYKGAQATCDRLLADTMRFSELGTGELCAMAELYMRLDSASNRNNDPVTPNEASVVLCLARAQAIDADSVEAFIMAQPLDRASRMSAINIVSTYLSIPRDSLVVEDELSETL